MAPGVFKVDLYRVGLMIISWSYFMSVFNETRFAVIRL